MLVWYAIEQGASLVFANYVDNYPLLLHLGRVHQWIFHFLLSELLHIVCGRVHQWIFSFLSSKLLHTVCHGVHQWIIHMLSLNLLNIVCNSPFQCLLQSLLWLFLISLTVVKLYVAQEYNHPIREWLEQKQMNNHALLALECKQYPLLVCYNTIG